MRIYHPEGSEAPLDPSKPFFTALLKASTIPNLPLPGLAPFTLVQPPLAAPRYSPGSTLTAAVIATDDPENDRENPWLAISPVFKGSWGLSYISKAPSSSPEEEVLEEFGDGFSFPKMKFWATGTFFDGTIEFPAAKIVS